MHRELRRWIGILLFNFLLVALLGLLMRYKIAFSFPFLQQKFILHGHSHFAFAGWITQALMVLIIHQLPADAEEKWRQFRPILWANLITAYGMLIAFPVQGYGAVSISFSTLNIFVAYWFAVRCWQAINRNKALYAGHRWLKAALVFNVVSSIGAFTLAYLMVSKDTHQDAYLLAVYFFLHFQYNGWFFFAVMGILSSQLLIAGMPQRLNDRIFQLFVWACVPAYLLSALWVNLHLLIYVIVVAAALAQVLGTVLMAQWLFKRPKPINILNSSFANNLILLAGIAFIIKIFLQLASTLPGLSDIAFGFRPIVIGYLHLVLLGVISLFLLAKLYDLMPLDVARACRVPLVLLVAGIILNQGLLGVQGGVSMGGIVFYHSDRWLFAAAFVMFLALVLINVRYFIESKKRPSGEGR